MPQPYALDFSAGNVDVATQSVGATNLSGQEITVECWFNSAPGFDAFDLIGNSVGFAGGYELFVSNLGLLQFRTGGGTGYDATGAGGATPVDGTWHHVAGVRSATGLRVYLDGLLFSSGNISGGRPMVASNLATRLGQNPNASLRFRGQMTEARVWNYARSQAEIQATKDTTVTGVEAGLVAAWHLDEGTGNVANSATGFDHLNITNPRWYSGFIPPPEYIAPPVSGGGGEPLAPWLSVTEGSRPDSAPLINRDLLIGVHGKLDGLSSTVDVQLGPWRAHLDGKFGEINGTLERIDQNTRPPEGAPQVSHNEIKALIESHDTGVRSLVSYEAGETRNTAWSGAEAVIRQLSGRHGYSIADGLDGGWSLRNDINNHSDALTGLLQGDMNDHEESTVNRLDARMRYHSDRIEDTLSTKLELTKFALINDNTDQTSTIIGVISGARDNINSNVDAAETAIVNRIGQAETTVNNHTTNQANSLYTRMSALLQGIEVTVDNSSLATRQHVTAEANRVIAAVNAAGGGGGGGSGADTTAINNHTTSEANRVIGALTGVIGVATAEINAAIAASTAAIAALTTTVTTVVTTTQSVLDRVFDVISALADLTSIVNDIRDMLQPGNPPAGVPTVVGSATWAGVFAFDVAADYYEVEVSEWPANKGIEQLSDATYLGNIGWCAFKSEAGYLPGDKLSFTSQVYPVSGIVATGLLLHGKPGTRGTVRAIKRL